MAPILFLFLMSAFDKTLESKWKNTRIAACTVRSVVGSKLVAGKGRVQGHPPKEYLSPQLTTVKILQCLYVDNGAFIFSSREDMACGLALIHKHFARFGLEMHIGQAGAQSKTECVFFPPHRFFNSKLPLSIAHSPDGCDADNKLTYGDDMLSENDCQCENAARQRREREEALYNELEETQPININDGYVTFCWHFKYLGSYISFGLTDDYDIGQQLTAANQSMGALKSVWDIPHLEIWSKYLLFCTIPMSSCGAVKHGPCKNPSWTNCRCSFIAIFVESCKY
jgi:hypothetical protein